MNGLDRLVLARSTTQASLTGRITRIEMLTVQALEHLPVYGIAVAEAEFGPSFAGPGAGRLTALLCG